MGAVFSYIAFYLIQLFTYGTTYGTTYGSDRVSSEFLRIALYVGVGISGVLTGAVARIKKFRDNLRLTMSHQTLRYVKKRQG